MNLGFLYGTFARFFGLNKTADLFKSKPTIKGYVQLDLLDARGRVIDRREGGNIWTLTGREFIAESLGLVARTPSREVLRGDRVAYIGVGTGSQAEVANIPSLVNPVAYKTGEFLAALSVPTTYPTSGTSTVNTTARFIREFALGEISLGYDVVVTELGLFTDGDPDDDWDFSATPTSFAAASGRAPVAYKTVPPITKTTGTALRAVWDVRII